MLRKTETSCTYFVDYGVCASHSNLEGETKPFLQRNMIREGKHTWPTPTMVTLDIAISSGSFTLWNSCSLIDFDDILDPAQAKGDLQKQRSDI